MARKKQNPANSLSRFMYGIYDYYYDRGMPVKTAKARMIDDTLKECSYLIKNEKDIPDQMLVILATWMSHALNHRGASISGDIKKKYPTGIPVPEEVVSPLRTIKNTKDAIDSFIEIYKGWEDGNE